MIPKTKSPRIEIHAKSTAVSGAPVKPGKTYPLSTLDHAMSKHRLSFIFYYHPSPTLTRYSLKESLTEVLTHYPAMAGRLLKDESGKWIVKCNDAGVRFLDARVNCTLDQWFQTATAEEESELASYEDMSSTEIGLWSPYYIQFTRFSDDSLAIGLSCTHMHSDPMSASLFVKAWGDMHRRSYIANPPFFHPPGLIPRSVPNLDSASARFLDSKSERGKSIFTEMGSATFRFSADSVKSLMAGLDDCTPFDVLAGLFWWRVGKEEVTVCVDFRKEMHAPLPYGFYGNALHFGRARKGVGEGLGEIARRVGGYVKGLEEEEYWSEIDWFGEKGGEAFQMYGPELTVVRMDHLFCYGAVFEKEERPVHVGCRIGGADGDGLIVVMPATEEGLGRTVIVTLPTEAMERICEDKEILKYGPSILFKE